MNKKISILFVIAIVLVMLAVGSWLSSGNSTMLFQVSDPNLELNHPGVYLAYGRDGSNEPVDPSQPRHIQNFPYATTGVKGVHFQLAWKDYLTGHSAISTAKIDQQISALGPDQKIIIDLYLRCPSGVPRMGADGCTPPFLIDPANAIYDPIPAINQGISTCEDKDVRTYRFLNYLDPEVMEQIRFTIESLANHYQDHSKVAAFEMSFGASGEPSPFIASTFFCNHVVEEVTYGARYGSYVSQGITYASPGGVWTDGWKQVESWMAQYWTDRPAVSVGNQASYTRWEELESMKHAISLDVGFGQTGIRTQFPASAAVRPSGGKCAWYETLRPDYTINDIFVHEEDAVYSHQQPQMAYGDDLVVISEESNEGGEEWGMGPGLDISVEGVAWYNVLQGLNERADALHIYGDHVNASKDAMDFFNKYAGKTAANTPDVFVFFQHGMTNDTNAYSCPNFFDIRFHMDSEWVKLHPWESAAREDQIYAWSKENGRFLAGTNATSWQDYYNRQTSSSTHRIALDISDGYASGVHDVDVTVQYKDEGTGDFTVIAHDGTAEMVCGAPITMTGSDVWTEATRTCSDADLGNHLPGVHLGSPDGSLFDIAIERGSADPLLHAVFAEVDRGTIPDTPIPPVPDTPIPPVPDTPIPPVPQVTVVSLNEVSLNTVDSNRNGLHELVLDQCIEIYNPKNTTESIAGWSLWSDDTMLYRYVSGRIRPQHVYVVWGSSLGSALPASSTIRLKDETGSIIDSILVDYSNDVLAREPNGSTTWQWSSGLSSSSCGKDN